MRIAKYLAFIRPQSARRCLSIQAENKIGNNVSVVRQITEEDIKNFTSLTGDTNPVHFQVGSKTAVVHGAFLNGLVSGVIGTKLPGPGTLVVSQTLNFPNKCYVNDVVTIKIELIEVRKIMRVKFTCEVEAEKKVVLHGDAKLLFDSSSRNRLSDFIKTEST